MEALFITAGFSGGGFLIVTGALGAFADVKDERGTLSFSGMGGKLGALKGRLGI